MSYADMREFMDALAATGEMITVDAEVDWNLEIGAITRRACEIGAPAVHFTKIKGYPEGYSILGGPLAGGTRNIFSRVAIALELDPDLSYQELLAEFGRRINHPIKPYQVATGPCKENILLGKEVNLFKFPAPYIHEGDGGRYLDTLGITITQDPDSAWVNWGVYRQMIHTKNRLGGTVNPFQHIGMMYYQKYEPRGIPMPFAVALGTDPTCMIAGSVAVPAGVNEADIAGGLRGEPIQLVKCETNELLVPATSEIVLEGVIMPRERWDEGPFGEATGYRASPRMPRPVFRVECITHRNNPILPLSNTGVPVDETDTLNHGLSYVVTLVESFKSAGLPVTGIYSPPEMIGNMLVVCVKKDHPGIAHEVASVLRSSKVGVFFPYLVVCDDDIDATRLDQVLHAVVTKCHPKRGIEILNPVPSHPLQPFLDLEDRRWARGASMTMDCTWPTEWDIERHVPPRISFEQTYPQAVKEKVIQGWSEVYGLTEQPGVWE